MPSELHELSLYALTELVRDGNVNATEIAQSCIERINQRESTVQALTWFDPEQVIAQALRIDSTKQKGVLGGVPVGVKDIIDVEGWPAGWGSPIYKNRVPHWDASCVALCRSVGANIFAKTVTTEFAYFAPGKTANPHNLAHTPGGSSMGSAAAVADQMLPFAFGTQTAASVIRPAAYCGVIGYKATYGSFDLQGICGLSPSLDTLGFICRDLKDIPLVRSVLCGDQSEFTPRDDGDPPRIGFARTPYWNSASDETRLMLENSVRQLDDAGAQCQDVTFPANLCHLADLQSCVMAFEVARSRAYEYYAYRDMLSPQFVSLVENGLQTTFEDYQASKQAACEARIWIAEQFNQFDVLIAPSAPGEAPEGHDSTGDPIFSRLWTLLHIPSITIPGGVGSRGLPLGIQLVGANGRDLGLVRDTDWVQRALGEVT